MKKHNLFLLSSCVLLTARIGLSMEGDKFNGYNRNGKLNPTPQTEHEIINNKISKDEPFNLFSSSHLRNRHTQVFYERSGSGFNYEPIQEKRSSHDSYMSTSDEKNTLSDDSASDEKSSISNAPDFSGHKKIIVKENNPLEDALEKFALEYRDRKRSCDLKAVRETLLPYVGNRRDFLKIATFTFTISHELAEVLYNGFSAGTGK